MRIVLVFVYSWHSGEGEGAPLSRLVSMSTQSYSVLVLGLDIAADVEANGPKESSGMAEIGASAARSPLAALTQVARSWSHESPC